MGAVRYALPTGLPSEEASETTQPVPVKILVKKKYGSMDGNTEEENSTTPFCTESKYLAGDINIANKMSATKTGGKNFCIKNYMHKKSRYEHLDQKLLFLTDNSKKISLRHRRRNASTAPHASFRWSSWFRSF